MKTAHLFIVSLFSLFLFSCENPGAPESMEKLSFDDELLKLMESSELNKNVLIINSIDKDKGLIYKLEDGWEYGWKVPVTEQEPGDEVCRGEGIPFARCVRDKVDEGYCVTVYKDGEEYVGVEAVCDPSAGADW